MPFTYGTQLQEGGRIKFKKWRQQSASFSLIEFLKAFAGAVPIIRDEPFPLAYPRIIIKEFNFASRHLREQCP